MKNLFKEAHKLTREIAIKYEVNYQAQFTLCLNFLLEKNKEMKEMKPFTGTEKQVKYAEDIRVVVNRMVGELEEANKIAGFKKETTREKHAVRIENVKEFLNSFEQAKDYINTFSIVLDLDRRDGEYFSFAYDKLREILDAQGEEFKVTVRAWVAIGETGTII